jgi:hypothetical protein
MNRDAVELVDRVGGTSIGSNISAMVAQGRSAEEATVAHREIWLGRRPLSNHTPALSIIRGRRLHNLTREIFAEQQFDDTPIPLFSVSCNPTEASRQLGGDARSGPPKWGARTRLPCSYDHRDDRRNVAPALRGPGKNRAARLAGRDFRGAGARGVGSLRADTDGAAASRRRHRQPSCQHRRLRRGREVGRERQRQGTGVALNAAVASRRATRMAACLLEELR